jgi:outer membrane protein TolC
LSIEAELLTAKSLLAKAEEDLLAAQLNYRLTITELQLLMGKPANEFLKSGL